MVRKLPTEERLARGGLTDNEASLLATVLRLQPVKPYRLLKIYEQSPVSRFNASKGNLYPIIRRLIAAGYLSSQKVEEDRRGSELLVGTAKGRHAVIEWARESDPTQALLDDPLRTRLMSFDLLTQEDIATWVERMKTAVEEKMAEVRSYAIGLGVPHQRLVVANAMMSLETRLRWLEMVRASLLDGSVPGPGTASKDSG